VVVGEEVNWQLQQQGQAAVAAVQREAEAAAVAARHWLEEQQERGLALVQPLGIPICFE
jgi:hypothetical protein